MAIINQDSYQDVPRNVEDYIDVLCKHTWHLKGEDQCYIFGYPPQGEAAGKYKIQNMRTREILVMWHDYQVIHDEESNQFKLLYLDREWNIEMLKQEPNYFTALMELQANEEYNIRFNGTRNGDPLEFIRQGYFD